MQRVMRLCVRCLNLVKNGYNVRVIRPMNEKGRCDFCDYPSMYGYEVMVNGKADEETDSSYPPAQVP